MQITYLKNYTSSVNQKITSNCMQECPINVAMHDVMDCSVTVQRLPHVTHSLVYLFHSRIDLAIIARALFIMLQEKPPDGASMEC